MAHRKWKETKQQPSLMPGPAVPGCSLVSFHFLWAILCPQAVHKSAYKVMYHWKKLQPYIRFLLYCMHNLRQQEHLPSRFLCCTRSENQGAAEHAACGLIRAPPTDGLPHAVSHTNFSFHFTIGQTFTGLTGDISQILRQLVLSPI